MEKRTGGCHCGNVRYEAELDLAQPAIECNCSHCQIKGLLLVFIPAGQCAVLQGEDELAEYRFNTEKIRHVFCKTCGVEPFGKGSGKDGAPMYAMNVRTIDDIDLAGITRMPFDGKTL